MHFTIFSYNRGTFLENCVASIEHCAPWAEVTIYDDCSDDPGTLEVLRKLSLRHRVVVPEDTGVKGTKHGGLYANMQAAFESFDSGEVLCFLQDDTQLVRKIDEEEARALDAFCSDGSEARFVHPTFIRGWNKRKNASRTRYDGDLNVYFVDRHERSAGTYYSDICLANVRVLREVNWNFLPREARNEVQARQKLKQMAYWRHPFVTWLPNVPAYRGKSKTLALRIAQKLRRSDLYPIRIMSDAERERFLQRDTTKIPYAEDFLEPIHGHLRHPWFYYPLQGLFWLKWLNSVEIELRRFLGK